MIPAGFIGWSWEISISFDLRISRRFPGDMVRITKIRR